MNGYMYTYLVFRNGRTSVRPVSSSCWNLFDKKLEVRDVGHFPLPTSGDTKNLDFVWKWCIITKINLLKSDFYMCILPVLLIQLKTCLITKNDKRDYFNFVCVTIVSSIN